MFRFNVLDELAQSCPVCCVVLDHDEAWTSFEEAPACSHCNQVQYMSSQSSEHQRGPIAAVLEDRPGLAHHLQHTDWFLKADDDAFVVVVENLRHLLSQHDTEKPVYLGHRFRLFVPQGYMSGGSGYVLSRKALGRFVQGFSKGRCEHFSSVEDMALSRCMETMGVKAEDSRDPNQRETFNPFRPENHLIPRRMENRPGATFTTNPDGWVSACFSVKLCVGQLTLSSARG